ncbi:YigZ family protein [Oceanisphaera profunda]|uniref:YigZ family protein n=1 Tax=Oceanisphaera profunda TaxID=1416627 RepID=A0A1Y0D5D1_9GAMM|nr:YigZ family protein [Oceanisphaera profunda]ART82417.1 YigZ family protein [Oceanisphaera profunda]
MSPYLIPATALVWEQEIKKSRFIAYIGHTPTPEDGKAFVDAIRAREPAARHHCWAFVAGQPSDSRVLGFSDDGEPSGTAGKPMLAQLQGSNIGEITAVVVRYFGGIKLGTGGLVRAYGGTLSMALAELALTERRIFSELSLKLQYSEMPLVEFLLAEFKGHWQTVEYGAEIEGVLAVESRDVADFCAQLLDRSQGRVVASNVVKSEGPTQP